MPSVAEVVHQPTQQQAGGLEAVSMLIRDHVRILNHHLQLVQIWETLAEPTVSRPSRHVERVRSRQAALEQLQVNLA
jgi:hypothetical protein